MSTTATASSSSLRSSRSSPAAASPPPPPGSALPGGRQQARDRAGAKARRPTPQPNDPPRGRDRGRPRLLRALFADPRRSGGGRRRRLAAAGAAPRDAEGQRADVLRHTAPGAGADRLRRAVPGAARQPGPERPVRRHARRGASTSASGSASWRTSPSSSAASPRRSGWSAPPPPTSLATARRRTPRELPSHACLQYGYLASGTTWKLSGPDGEHPSPSRPPSASTTARCCATWQSPASASRCCRRSSRPGAGRRHAPAAARRIPRPGNRHQRDLPAEPAPRRQGAGVHRLPRRADRHDALLGPAAQLSVRQKDDPDRRERRAPVEFRNRGMRKAPLPRTGQGVAFFLCSHPLPGPSAKHGAHGRIRGSL